MRTDQLHVYLAPLLALFFVPFITGYLRILQLLLLSLLALNFPEYLKDEMNSILMFYQNEVS